MSKTTERHQCSEHVFSGERWDFSGHPCQINATTQSEDGKWWCKRHNPEAVKAKIDARAAKFDAERSAHAAASREITNLLCAIGVEGSPTRSFFSGSDTTPTGAYIGLAELRRLASCLGAQP